MCGKRYRETQQVTIICPSFQGTTTTGVAVSSVWDRIAHVGCAVEAEPWRRKQHARKNRIVGSACGDRRGSNAGYVRHGAAGEVACGECRDAHRLYRQMRREAA